MNDSPQLLSSVLVHTNTRYSLRRDEVVLPSGKHQDVVWVDHPGAVGIAALDPDGRMVLVRQYRHSIRQDLVEIPAGRLEPGEDRLQAALRELEEETGLRAAEWELLQDIHPAPGFASERLTIYLATRLVPAGADAAQPDEDEEFELVRLSPAEVMSATTDAKTLIAAALLLLRGNDGRPLPD
ncbi:MAG: ADP-ribose pyrophosphatase [Planctomycetota bacterium]|jgi:ADP-ribose pyrophosphatase